jgi:hypothetical protein
MCAAEACQVVWKGSGPISPMKALAAAIDPKFKPNDYGNKQVGIVLRTGTTPPAAPSSRCTHVRSRGRDR